ncbi:hypothetical protein [Nocardia niwae]|uniref:hypothetical protein n=1 Tax=Nocardia niwae TaxID=626084 RepID=UPI0007A52958|nr:hypothetical protein [Nocardia niwae]
MTLFSDVARFNAACGVRMRDLPGWVPDDEVQLALRLVDEERNELAAALTARDMTEVADAIADGLYVRAGLLLRLGIARKYITDLLVPSAQTPSWSVLSDDDIAGILSDLEDDDRTIRRAVTARNLIQVDTYTHRTMYALSSLAVLLRIPLDEVWQAVNDSNMAKLVDGKVVRRESDNKILKPEGWTAPDIAGVLARHGWKQAA